MSVPLSLSCSASASETVDTIVPICAMLRRSLSSLAAASLRAAAAGGSFVPSNHTAAFGAPPARSSSSRTMRADGMLKPIAALATVLARLIFARSNATLGISLADTAVANSANRTARFSLLVGKRHPLLGQNVTLNHSDIIRGILRTVDRSKLEAHHASHADCAPRHDLDPGRH